MSEGYTIFDETDDNAQARQSWVKACMAGPTDVPILTKRLDMVIDWIDK